MTYQEVQRLPVLYDVIAVAAGVVVRGRHYESVRLTVTAVFPDRSVFATETAGGEVIHLSVSEYRVVSPPRGAWS